MISVLSGEYTTHPVRTGISDAPRWFPAKLICTPTCPGSIRVTRSRNSPITSNTRITPIAITPNFKNGAALFISNSASPPFLNISIPLLPPRETTSTLRC